MRKPLALSPEAVWNLWVCLITWRCISPNPITLPDNCWCSPKIRFVPWRRKAQRLWPSWCREELLGGPEAETFHDGPLRHSKKPPSPLPLWLNDGTKNQEIEKLPRKRLFSRVCSLELCDLESLCWASNFVNRWPHTGEAP